MGGIWGGFLAARPLGDGTKRRSWGANFFFPFPVLPMVVVVGCRVSVVTVVAKELSSYGG